MIPISCKLPSRAPQVLHRHEADHRLLVVPSVLEGRGRGAPAQRKEEVGRRGKEEQEGLYQRLLPLQLSW